MLAPVAVAGYLHYKKRSAEREAQEKLDSGQSEGENSSGDNESSSSHEHVTSTANQMATQTEKKPLGPMGKFKLFCANLEKEVQKAQERKRLEGIQKALGEAHCTTSGGAQTSPAILPDAQAIPALDTTDTSLSEEGAMTEKCTLGQPDEQEIVCSNSGNVGEPKNQVPETANIPYDAPEDRHQVLVTTLDSVPDRLRMITD